MKRLKWIALTPALALATSSALAQQEGKKEEGKRDADSGGDRRARMMERMMRDDGAPKVGELAPTFKLDSLDGKQSFDLAEFKGGKPVVLFFGSYT